MLITNFEHVLMVEPLIYKILLSCHKQHQIFQASKGFSGSFNKHGYVNDSENNIRLRNRFNQILYSQRNDSTNVRLQERFNQTIYGQTNSLTRQYAVQRQKHQKKPIKYCQTLHTHDSQLQSQSAFACSTQVTLTKRHVCFRH